MMEEEDGKLTLPLGPSPEWGGADVRSAVGRDPSFQLAAAHRLARDLVDAAKLLGEEPDAMWLDVEKRLPQHSAGESGIELFRGQALTESHRHHSHMAGLYPFDTLDLSDKATRDIAAKTYGTWVARGTGYWSGWCVPWASILNTHVGNAQAAMEFLRSWDAYFCNPGHGSLHNAYAPGFSTFTIFEGVTNENTRALLIGGSQDAYQQIFSISEDGTATIEKHGHTMSRGRFCRIIVDGKTIQWMH